MSRAELDELIGLLDAQGVFDLRNAISYVTEVLDLSRANVYKQLSNLRRPRRRSQRS